MPRGSSLPALIDGPVGRPVTDDPATLLPDVVARRAAWPVLLVSMPFVSMSRPSLQIGLLSAIARSHGFPTDTAHLNLDLAAQIGEELYESISQHRGSALGDWLFSLAAFGDRAPDPGDRFLADHAPQLVADAAQRRSMEERLREVRHQEVPRYLDHLVADLPWDRYRVVGFTSTFAQSVPSIALAARLKERYPDLVVLFGGANLDGVMGPELVRSSPAIDYGITGEADLAFTEFLVALSEGRDPAGVGGVLCRRDGEVAPSRPAAPFDRLDELPVPDFEEYFARAEALDLLPRGGRRDLQVPFESSRGCWWGAKRHCTFCGLNGETMAYRAKSPDRVRRELAELARRCRTFDFEAVDNIVDTGYLETLFPALVEDGSTYRLFYEVKADLDRRQVGLLADAGVRRIQPGIESLSSHVLRLMRKGTRSWQNVNLLRWCRYHDITVGWNLLYGFPGETDLDYAEQATLLRQVVHLPPPLGAGRIWMERFSPIFLDREAFPATSVHPEASYGYVYPEAVDLDRLAYFFDYDLADTLHDEAFVETRSLIQAWMDAWSGEEVPSLVLWRSPGLIQIEDGRSEALRGTHTFEDPLAAIYLACSDAARSAAKVKEVLGLPCPTAEVEGALDGFVERGLMHRDGNLFLSLAIPSRPGTGPRPPQR